ncbi:CU044_5270 family protein [Patulibacter defluvii]|uniref:CU044_5270 family protein n=1 Tax=Patulibacter defluvii TaxID=3095358 RepID=UPI002A75F3C8|nr:CU044_5270 family protein [Patulibacter sp. DM4]
MTDPALQLLERLDPVDVAALRDVPPPPIPARILATPRDPAPRSPFVPRRPLRVALGGGVATAAVVVGVSVLSSSGGPAVARAADVLRATSDAADAQAVQAPTGAIAYTKIEQLLVGATDHQPPYGYYRPSTVEAWVAPDGSGRTRTVTDPIRPIGPRDRERMAADRDAPPVAARPRVALRRYGAGQLVGLGERPDGLPSVRELPADRERLRETLRRVAAASDVPVDVGIFEQAATLLMEAGPSPRLRAALFDVMATIPGVRLDGTARDPRGRSGTAVSIDSDYTGRRQRDTLIFVESSARPLAHVTRLLEPSPLFDGDLIEQTVVVSSGDVRQIGARP